MKQPKDLQGLEFGKWQVIAIGACSVASNSAASRWLCRCDCGTERLVLAQNLLSKKSQSCGRCVATRRALDVKHPAEVLWIKRHKPTYGSWEKMKYRCCNPAYEKYHRYGGRGIVVCSRWMYSFENFLADMGERPEGKTLDRIDVNGNYEPNNCRWATVAEQNRNTSKTVRVTFMGQDMVLQDLAVQEGVGWKSVKLRIDKGHSVEEAVALSRVISAYGTDKIRKGDKYGFLTAHKPARDLADKRKRFWYCKCVCGSLVAVRADKLRHGRTKSCGCRQIGRCRWVLRKKK